MDDRFHKEQIASFAESDSFSFLINDLDKKMYEKFKISVDKEERERIYLTVQGIKELLEIIQKYKNDLVTAENE